MKVHSIHRRVAMLLVALAALLLAGCSDTTAATIRVVEPAEAAQLLSADPSPTLIDVRTPAEYAEGHLEGAILIDYNAADFRDRVAELPRDADYVIYCRSGNRSAGARQIMSDLGFTSVADVEGGIIAWLDAGLPVTTA